MKKILFSLLVALNIVSLYSCKESQLQDLTSPEVDKRNISGEGIVLNNVSISNEYIRIPFKISLSGNAGEAFQVGLTLFNDTVTQLINNGTLTNTVLLPTGSVEYPNVINVAYGNNSSEGIAIVRRYAIERNYGKNLVFALKLNAPGKNNKIAPGKSTIIVNINTTEILKPTDLHYLDINGGGIYNVSSTNKVYDVGPAGITIPLTVSVINQPSTAFNVTIKDNIDTIATLVANGGLPANTIHLKPEEYTLDTLARIGSGSSSVKVRLQIPWPVFDANIIANKKFAFALSLVNPTNHVLHPTKSKVIILIDPSTNLDNNSYITGNGTGLKAEYYNGSKDLDNNGTVPVFATRIDKQIEFTDDAWPDGVKNSAGTSLGRDNFSVRWTGEFLAPLRGEYIFYQTKWDDGSRLYVNGVLLIDDFRDAANISTRVGKITLQRGVKYKIEVHHREAGGGQSAFLEYEVPNAGLSGKRIVPKSQLFPAP